MKTHEQFVKELHEINPDVAVIGKYTKAVEPVSVKCLVCGKEWTPKAYSLLQGHGCPRCAKSGTSFMEQFIRLAFIKKSEVVNKNLTLLHSKLHSTSLIGSLSHFIKWFFGKW